MPRRVSPLIVPLLLTVACGPSRQSRPTPPPPFAGKPIYEVPTSAVDAYGASLQFDTTRPAVDTLTVQTQTGDTLHLELEPEVGAGALADTAIATGRIIARVHSNAPFPPLGLGRGSTYFWVNGAADRARGVMIPADSQYRRFDRPLIFAINGRCGATCCGFTSDFFANDGAAVDSAIDDMHKSLPGGT